MLIDFASINDAASILELQRLAYQSEAVLYGDWSIPPLMQTVEALRAEIARMIFLKATEDEAIVGSVRAVAHEGTCSIGRLIVHPQYQRRGIGTRLMGAIEAMFPNAAVFELFTGTKSTGNIRLYERLGYTASRTARLSDTVSLVFMTKRGPGAL